MIARNRKLFIAAQLLAAAVLVYFIWSDLAPQWADFRAQPLDPDLRVSAIAISGLIVLATYALLIQTWRILLASAGASLPFRAAARIWTISNLWRYVPGKVWQIGAMTAMAHRERVSGTAAAGTAIVSTILNIATGIALAMLLAGRWMDEWNPSARAAAVLLLGVAIAGFVSLPWLLPRLGSMATRATGKQVTLRSPPAWAIAAATAANVLSWVLYGMAFMWLVQGLFGETRGAPWQYIAVFTASYVVGYLFLIAPGGLGPREGVMLWLLVSLSLATEKEAALVTVASRLWLTFLELVPGLLFLTYDRMRPPQVPLDTPSDGASRGS